MPAKGDTQINTFVGGLNTEASSLAFPPNSSLDEKNFRLNRNGSRDRRLGLDYEDGYAIYPTGQTTNQIQTSRQKVFVWPTPSGYTEVEIGVIQIGTKLYFIDLFTASPSANVLNGGIGLDAAAVSSILDNTVVFDFTIVNNNLIVVSEGLDTPFLLSYDYPNDTISYQTSRVKIRDLYGVADGLGLNERPTTLTDAHKYNLRNQGWDSGIVTTCGTEALECTQSVLGVYPSNSDTWSLGKIADVSSADIDKYDPNTLARNSFDLGKAAKGHYIIDLYNRGQSREDESGISITNTDRELGRISTVAAYGGRLFYSGIRSRVTNPDLSPKLSGTVLFSKIAEVNEDLVKCYQEADPTSPTNNDIVDTDGGVIQISEASRIIKLITIKSSVFVFAENGIWEIRGDEGGFRATSFQINKVSSIGVLSRDSIVEANGTIFFWADQGIFALTPNQFQTGYDTTNISLTNVQTAYNSIPDLAKQNARGYYDVSQNRIRWLFNSDYSETIVIPDPEPIPITFSVATIVDTTGSEPKVARLNDTTGIVVYKKGASNEIFYRILTLEDDLTITSSSESSFISISPDTLSGYAVQGLADDKIIISYMNSVTNNTYCAIGNWNGSSMSFGSSTLVSTDFRQTLITSQLKIAKVNANRIILVGRYVTSFRPAAMVIDIDGADNITNGSIAFTTSDSSISNPEVTMLTETKGVMSWNNVLASMSAEVFTISGTSITFNGTNYDFPNATQYPTASSRALVNADISSTSSSNIFVVGQGTLVISGVTTYAPIVMNMTEASGVLTSTTAFQDTAYTETSSPGNIYPAVNTENGDAISVYTSNTLATNESWITKYIGTTPAQEYVLDLETYTGSFKGQVPSIIHLVNGKYITVIWSTTTNSTIMAYGVSAT